MNHPKISVIIPNYNNTKYIGEAIESVLSQTFKDFELLIYDDKSTDNSVEVIKSYQKKNKRIRLLIGEKNLGEGGACNVLLANAKGKYIARLDSDDIMFPDRLEKQFSFMEKNSDISVLGSNAELFGENIKKEMFYPQLCLTHNQIVSILLFNSPIVNPSSFIRRDFIKKSKCQYKQDFQIGADYLFWVQLFFNKSCSIRYANLPDVLIYYRLHGNNATKLYIDKRKDYIIFIYSEILKYLGLPPTNKNIKIHYQLGNPSLLGKEELSYNFFNLYFWKKKLLAANKTKKLLDEKSLNKFLTRSLIFSILWTIYYKSFLRYTKLRAIYSGIKKLVYRLIYNQNR